MEEGMNRRNFIKSGLACLASASTITASTVGQDRSEGTYVDGQKIALDNKYLGWDLLMSGGAIQSLGVRNKLSGHYHALQDSKEILLRFSSASARVDIPWWSFDVGPDNDNATPDQERGYLAGFHSEDFLEEEKWEKAENLLLHGARDVLGPSVVPPIFRGYTWFRQRFELPREGEGEAVAFCFGGYNQEDWNEYWVYANATLIGHWKGSGRWRMPNELVVYPGSHEYKALRFGGDNKNLLAIRTFGCDKRFEDVSNEVLDRFIFDARLVDQFIVVGKPYLDVSTFKLTGWHQAREGERPECVFALTNADAQLQIEMHYELAEFTRRKWFEVKNLGTTERLLLDVDVDDFLIEAPMTEGDYGQPVIIAEEMFSAIEHPAGVNQGMTGRVRLRHFPGKKLAAGASLRSKVSIVGVSAQGEGKQQFLNYIQAQSPRSKLLSIYDPLGINGFPDEPCWTLNDNQMLETINLLQKWQERGVKFDFYVPDVGWQDRGGDLTRFLPNCFPDGPQKVINRVSKLGMKWGLWFASNRADWSVGLNPKMTPSRIDAPGGRWPGLLYRDGFLIDDTSRQLCVASEPYFSTLRDALLYHIRNYSLRLFKIDTGTYYCNDKGHGHLPGKYSTEACYDALIEIARVTRQAAPDIYIMWYWGITSPFFALYGDTISDKRLSMEAASTGDYPACFFRDAVTLTFDQGNQFAEFVPPINKDSLGIFITDTWVANSMRKERWREATVMDLGRGSPLFPQIWGDLYSFSDEDVQFLSWIQKIAKQNESIFRSERMVIGDPWKNEIYGYAYSQGGHGFLFMNNMSFDSRPLSLKLDKSLGLDAPTGTRLVLRSQFPERLGLRMKGQEFESGKTVTTWLRPFEVAMWEIAAGGAAKLPQHMKWRELPGAEPDVSSQQLESKDIALAPGMEIDFADPEGNFSSTVFRSPVPRPSLEELARAGYIKRIMARQTSLPSEIAGGYLLAIVLRLRMGGKPWRHGQLADLIQIRATVDGQGIQPETVPNFRQILFQTAPWMVFKTRMSSAWSGKELRFAINGYLPPEVEWREEIWLVPQWWE
jgi:hypothetical protein